MTTTSPTPPGSSHTERTPLLLPEIEGQMVAAQTEHAQKVSAHQALYDRFSRSQKIRIVTLVAFTGLIPLFIVDSFVPSIPRMAEDLHSTAVVISLAVSISAFAGSIGTLFWATYSGFYGRRIIYLISLPLVTIGSFGVGASRSVTALMCWRVVQAFAGSAGMSLGAGVIGDIYKLEERGTAMGIFYSAVLLGPAMAPIAGGFTAHYSSWRVMQYAIGLAGLIMSVSMYAAFPETSHPGALGVDRLTAEQREKRGPVLLNPFASLALLRSPNLAAVTFATATALLADFVLVVPIASTLGARYNITNEAAIGACFIPLGVGNFVGAPIAGWISDRQIIKWRARRGGVWLPEDRLRATLAGSLILVPVAMLLCGWATVFVDGWPGLAMNLVGFFLTGLGVDLVLPPVGSYAVDILHDRSAEISAATAAARNIFIALCLPAVLPLIGTIGVGWTNTISAVLAWIGAGLLLLTIRHGKAMRQWVDVGFTTSEESN